MYCFGDTCLSNNNGICRRKEREGEENEILANYLKLGHFHQLVFIGGFACLLVWN